MFGFRKVRPPLTTFQRVDIELLLRKTVATVGKGFVCQLKVVTAISELRIDASSPDRLLQSATREVEARMPMIASRCEVSTARGTELGHPSTYHPSLNGSAARICIADETLADPLRAVMELSYQYATHFWHSTPEPTALDTDPRTTNLLPICCGLGVLASDACLYDQQWSQAGWTGWSLSRSGYYTAVEIGYALALLARVRGEVEPPWWRALRLDSRATARKAWRYFAEHAKSGGSLLFDAPRIPASDGSIRELAAWLRGDDHAFALAAGYALARQNELSPQVIEAAIHATRCGDKDLVPVATRLLGGARSPDAETRTRVRQLIRSTSPQICLAAIQSANALGMPLVEFSTRISKLLDIFAEDSFALVEVIGQQGRSLGLLGPKICDHLARAIREIDDDLITALLDCLQRIVEDPKLSIETQIKSPEIREEALHRLAILS